VGFIVDGEIGSGKLVELSITWPARLDNGCPLKLVIVGRVLRSAGSGSAAKTIQHEFRVCGPAESSRQTILLADDDECVLDLVANILSTTGLQVLRARDGSQALSMAQQHPGRIDMLLSDVQMGPQMTGIELATRLQVARPDTRILLMSGSDFQMEAKNAGWEFIRKPFLPDGLKRRVQSLLGAV
jgi:CheY-like chemotaxis protein